MLNKKKEKFSVMLTDIASNLKVSAEYFHDFKIKNESSLREFADHLKNLESKGDSYVHTVITELNKVFITPIEREDILQLAMSMDDILDGIEGSSALFDIYAITNPDEYMVKFVENIKLSADEILLAVNLLADKKLLDMRQHAIKIKDYESKCDDLYREARRQLFATEKDPIKVMKYKEIYDILEEIADSCQHVANTLESIIMKNA
ncbi:DUF47 domain-containing protein [Fictibacillus aquaticus]|uniref:Phosphate transport regulator n=1 Tax=Fictibacillus aquaticus TaxID=2021314 RepID=A0A235F631_9BACL|nr:DUF47 domain-containing protein [Fictibacillus aquaticus]OYD56175.1 hypothetical protein CGZ90_18895 [Fictibacillus aquaticus]